jgi:hypothetical protein
MNANQWIVRRDKMVLQAGVSLPDAPPPSAASSPTPAPAPSPTPPPPPPPSPPTVVSVGNDTKTEGLTLVHGVTLSAATTSATVYSFSLGGGTAAVTDYGSPTFSDGVTLTGGGTTLTVPTGVLTFTISVPTVDDALTESSETVLVVVGGSTGTGTILDNDIAAPYCPVSSYALIDFSAALPAGITMSSGHGIFDPDDAGIPRIDGVAAAYIGPLPVVLYSNQLTITITDPSVKKFDTVSWYEYTGDIETIVTDEYGTVSTQLTVIPTVDAWYQHSIALGPHPVSPGYVPGFFGNIKTITFRFTGVTGIDGTLIDKVELSCTNPSTVIAT